MDIECDAEVVDFWCLLGLRLVPRELELMFQRFDEFMPNRTLFVVPRLQLRTMLVLLLEPVCRET